MDKKGQGNGNQQAAKQQGKKSGKKPMQTIETIHIKPMSMQTFVEEASKPPPKMSQSQIIWMMSGCGE